MLGKSMSRHGVNRQRRTSPEWPKDKNVTGTGLAVAYLAQKQGWKDPGDKTFGTTSTSNHEGPPDIILLSCPVSGTVEGVV